MSPAQFSYVVLPGGQLATVECVRCGWRLPAAPPSPFDPAEAMVAAQGEHQSCPGKIVLDAIVQRAIDLLRSVNDCFLPAHTREHVLAAHDLLEVARDELRRASDDAPCLAGQAKTP